MHDEIATIKFNVFLDFQHFSSRNKVVTWNHTAENMMCKNRIVCVAVGCLSTLIRQCERVPDGQFSHSWECRFVSWHSRYCVGWSVRQCMQFACASRSSSLGGLYRLIIPRTVYIYINTTARLEQEDLGAVTYWMLWLWITWCCGWGLLDVVDVVY